jgi:hypothetical protein
MNLSPLLFIFKALHYFYNRPVQYKRRRPCAPELFWQANAYLIPHCASAIHTNCQQIFTQQIFLFGQRSLEETVLFQREGESRRRVR